MVEIDPKSGDGLVLELRVGAVLELKVRADPEV
jgi:hypothetical protein